MLTTDSLLAAYLTSKGLRDLASKTPAEAVVAPPSPLAGTK
jgi:hypothetical protein